MGVVEILEWTQRIPVKSSGPVEEFQVERCGCLAVNLTSWACLQGHLLVLAAKNAHEAMRIIFYARRMLGLLMLYELDVWTVHQAKP